MSYSGEQHAKQDAVEALLESATPRPTPAEEDERRVRSAVHAEWQKVAGRRKSTRNVVRFALAASVIVAVAISFNAFRATEVVPIQVATIDKTHGSIHFLGEQDEYRGLVDTTAAYSGQVMMTGNDAGIGLAWGRGGSLRVDEQTKVEFESATAIFLHSGRVYFDSSYSSSDAVMTINTEHGSVNHLGTRYMTEADSRRLLVSVRDGEVEIDGHYYDHTATKGKQVRIEGSGRPSSVDLPSHGAAWSWVEAVSPDISLDGMSTHEFLEWVGRETGHEVVYTSTDAESTAKRGILNGTVDTDPRNALRIRMMGEDLDVQFDGGAINVSTKHR